MATFWPLWQSVWLALLGLVADLATRWHLMIWCIATWWWDSQPERAPQSPIFVRDPGMWGLLRCLGMAPPVLMLVTHNNNNNNNNIYCLGCQLHKWSMRLHKHNYDQFCKQHTHTQSHTHTLTHTYAHKVLWKKAHGKVTLSVEKVRPIVGRNKVQTDGS